MVTNAGDFGFLLRDALGDAFERTLDNVVEDCLFQRVVVDGPGEELALGVAGRGGEIELGAPLRRALAAWSRRMHLVPLAFLVVRVVGFVVDDGDRAAPRRDAGAGNLLLPALGPAAWDPSMAVITSGSSSELDLGRS